MPLKIISFFVLFIVVLGLLAVFSSKRISTEITIPADSEAIWSVLMDVESYRHWNPVLIPLAGNLQEGAIVRYQWQQPSGEVLEIESKVLTLNNKVLLHQKGGTSGLLTFNHRYQLTPLDGKTRVVQSEVYRGIGVWFWDAEQMEPQYAAVNRALKEEVLQRMK